MAVTKENLIKKIYQTLKSKGFDVEYPIEVGDLNAFNFYFHKNGDELCVDVKNIKVDGEKIIIKGTYLNNDEIGFLSNIILDKGDLTIKDLKFILGEVECFDIITD